MALRCGIVFWAIIRDLAELAFPPLHFFDLRELHEADAEAWIKKRHMHQLLDPAEKALLKNTKIAYQSGKGTKRLVSILIPSDMVEAMRKLTDQELRKQGSKIPLALSPNANEKFALARIKFQQVDIWRIKLHKFQL